MKSVLFLLLVAAGPAWGQAVCGTLFATVDAAGEVGLDLWVQRSQYEDPPADWVEIVVARKIHGTCGEPVVVSPDAVWPLPGPGEELADAWSEPIPGPGLPYRYEVMARDGTGALHGLGCSGGPSADVVSHGEAICVRARLVHEGSGYYGLLPCEEGCWEGFCSVTSAGLGISEGQALYWSLSGQVLDFYGAYLPPGGMPTNCTYLIDRWEENDGGCGPVPNRHTSWGQLKSIYR